MFDARLLASFLAVAQFKHFGRAAQATNATQPGVSQHIAKLERQLGFRLVERTKRSVSLTPAGRAFYERAGPLVAMMQKMRDEGLLIARGGLGQLAIGLTSFVIHSDIPNRIAVFREENPEIEVQFTVQGGDRLKQLLDQGELDVAITTLPLAAADYDTEVLCKQAIGVALPKTHPLAGRKVLTLDALKDDQFIVVPREYDPHSHDALIARMRSLGGVLKIAAYETPSLNALARVSVGEGLALVPLGYQSDKHDSIRVVRLKDAVLATSLLYVTVRRDHVRPPTQRLLVALRSSLDMGEP